MDHDDEQKDGAETTLDALELSLPGIVEAHWLTEPVQLDYFIFKGTTEPLMPEVPTRLYHILQNPSIYNISKS